MKSLLTTIICLFSINIIYSSVIIVCNKCDISDISIAIDKAKNHDTIIIKKGTYYEFDIEINKPIKIIGENSIIDVEFNGGGFNIKSDSVYLSNLKINNIKRSYTKDIAGIVAYKSDHFVIENIEFNNPFFAIFLQKSRNGIIRNNIIKGVNNDVLNSGNGIHLWDSKNIKIENNKIINMRDGIYLEFVSAASINNNISEKNLRYGLHFMFSNENKYSNNIFINNAAGVAVMFSKNIIIHSNRFENNWGSSSYGLLLKEIYDAKIENNYFYQNTIGIAVEGSNRINYNHNIFKQNGWATKISGGCYENIFTDNDYLNNTFDLSYKGRENDNVFSGNYWSNYVGYDLNHDGIGDVAFMPIKLFSYIVNSVPEAITLHRSLFVELINFSEKVAPIFTPKYIMDKEPKIKPINYVINY